MASISLLFPGNCQVSVTDGTRFEFFPDDIEGLSDEKQAWIQQSQNIIYRIGSESWIEFVVKSAVIEHSASFLSIQLQIPLESHRVDEHGIYINLKLNPYLFPTIFAYLNGVFCGRDIHIGSMIGSNAAALKSLIDYLQIGMNLSASARFVQMLMDLQCIFHTDISQTADFLQCAITVMFESNENADTHHIEFECNFLDFSNQHQIEQFSRLLYKWLQNIQDMEKYSANIFVDEYRISIYFISSLSSLLRPPCIGWCTFSRNIRRNRRYPMFEWHWCDPNEYVFFMVGDRFPTVGRR